MSMFTPPTRCQTNTLDRESPAAAAEGQNGVAFFGCSYPDITQGGALLLGKTLLKISPATASSRSTRADWLYRGGCPLSRDKTSNVIDARLGRRRLEGSVAFENHIKERGKFIRQSLTKVFSEGS